MAQGSTEAQFGEILIQEKCVSSLGTGTEGGGGGCLIATAAFGSEMAPQVPMLREIRANTLLQTESYFAFMLRFELIETSHTIII